MSGGPEPEAVQPASRCRQPAFRRPLEHMYETRHALQGFTPYLVLIRFTLSSKVFTKGEKLLRQPTTSRDVAAPPSKRQRAGDAISCTRRLRRSGPGSAGARKPVPPQVIPVLPGWHGAFPIRPAFPSLRT